MRMMAQLKGKRGQFAVYGNWDKRRRFWLPFRVIEQFYEQAGWKLLSNESFSAGAFELYGLDDYKIGIPRVYPSDGGHNTYSILLAHNPDAVADLPEDELARFDLALCGHTHGGQFRLPWGGVIAPNQGFFPKITAGIYRQGGTQMVVSRGLGNSWIPIRLFNRPEVLLVSLRRAKTPVSEKK